MPVTKEYKGLGACVLSNDLPFSGLGLDIFNRRVKGQSWKQIADDLNLGSPSKARSQFTKLTGITDYKIKGDDLLKLAKGGIDPKLTTPAVKKAKKVAVQDDAVKVLEETLNNTKKPFFQLDIHNALDMDYDLAYWNLNPNSGPGAKLTAKQIQWLKGEIPLDDLDLKSISDIYDRLALPKPPDLDEWAMAVKKTVDVPDIASLEDAAKSMNQTDTANSLIQEYFKDQPGGGGLTGLKNKLTNKQRLWVENPNKMPLEPHEMIDAFTRAGLPKSKWPSPLTKLDDGLKAQANKVAPKLPPKAKPKAPEISIDWDYVSHPKAAEVMDLHDQGKGYLAIKNSTGLDMSEIDKIIFNNFLSLEDGDVWKAYLHKPGSDTGFKAVKSTVFEMRKNGATLQDIYDVTEIDPKVIKAIIDDKWHLPAPGSNQYYVPPDTPPGGKYSNDYGNYQKSQEISAHHEFEFPDPYKLRAEYENYGSARASLREYTSGTYREINAYLRGKGPGSPRIRGLVEGIDSGMKPTTNPMTVRRGMNREGFGMGHLTRDQIENLAGTVFQDKGFMSTAIDRGAGFRDEINLILDLPAGVRGSYVQPISHFPNEQEFLVKRGTRIMVTRVDDLGNGRFNVYARAIV